MALAVIGFMLPVRFVALEDSPPGFYNDEAHIAAHVICLSRTGHDAGGQDWPSFSGSGGGGYASPTHLYPAAVWIRIFGVSIGAFRAYAAMTMCAAIAGTFFLARVFIGGGAIWVALCASLSPWMFQFSRMAVDDPAMFLLGMCWGMYFFFRSTHLTDAVLAAGFVSVAAYSYPSGRIVLPMLLLPMTWLKRGRTGMTRRYLATFCVAGLAFCLPLIDQIVSGTLMTRYNVVGIVAEHYRRTHGLTWWAAWGVFLKSMLRHLGANYLFLHGDANLRHSTQFCGELSWLDIAALCGGAAYLFFRLFARRKVRWNAWPAFCALGFLIGIVPAALTWEGIPHSLRSAASWPFASLLCGYLIWTCQKWWKPSSVLFAIVALAFAIGFTRDYFLSYPSRAKEAFQSPVKRAAEYAARTGDWRPFHAAADAQDYDSQAREYFLMAFGQMGCDRAGASVSTR